MGHCSFQLFGAPRESGEMPHTEKNYSVGPEIKMSLYGKEDTIDRVSEGLGHSLASRIPELQQQKSVKSSGNTAAHEAQAKGNNMSCSGPQSQGRGDLFCPQPRLEKLLAVAGAG